MPERQQHPALGYPVDHREGVGQRRPETHPRRRPFGIQVTLEQALAQTVQLPRPLHARRRVQPCELHRAGQAQTIGHGRHDELALQRSDRERQPLLFVGQHQVVAALGVQGDPDTCQVFNQICRMRTAGDQHLFGIHFALAAFQRHAAFVQSAVLDVPIGELHPRRLGRFEQRIDDPVRIEEMSGSGEEQPSLDLHAQLRRRMPHCTGRPEVDRHRLLLQASLQGLQCRARRRTFEYQQRAILAEQVAAPEAAEQALPGAEAGFVQGADAGHAALEWRRAQVEQQAGEPGDGPGQVLPVQAQWPHRVHQHGWQALEDRQIGNREDLLGGQVPGVAIGGAVAGGLTIDQQYPLPLAGQLQGAGDADDAGADHGDVGIGIAHEPSRLPSSSRRRSSGLPCFNASGSSASGKSW